MRFLKTSARDRAKILQNFVSGKGPASVFFDCEAAEETLHLAEAFADFLGPGTVLALEGDLGSGKTVFVKGVALGLGLKHPEEVKSPTFVLMHIYPTKIPLYHFDLYRLEKENEIEDIGFEDFVYDTQAIICVEWAERGVRFFPPTTFYIRLEVTGETSRRVQLTRRERPCLT